MQRLEPGRGNADEFAPNVIARDQKAGVQFKGNVGSCPAGRLC